MRVLCGIIANDAARFSEFWSCVLRLQVPEGSVKDQVIGGDWCSARNELAQRCIDDGYDYLWFMDDDHSFAPDLLQKLLKAALDYDLPIVNPLCTTRTAPFHLVTFAANPDPDATDRYLPISLDGLPGEGVVELEAGGCAGMLIRRDVLEALGGNWFEYGDRSEDIVFCEKAKAAGFSIHADLSARLGHITTAVVMPGIIDGEWATGITVGRDMQLSIPKAEDLVRDQEPEHPVGVVDGDTLRWSDEDGVEHSGPWIEPELPPAVTEPCLLCGKQSTWHDIHQRWGCAEHEPQHDDWATYYERAEIWLMPDENRWYGRVLNGEGQIAKSPLTDRSWSQEAQILEAISNWFGEVPVFHVFDELADSRNTRRFGPPQRMWGREGI